MAYELQAKVYRIEDEQTYGTFTKRAFVVIIDEETKYPQKVSLECQQGKIAELEGINEGDVVDIRFDLRGREIDDGRVFNSLVCWSIKACQDSPKGTNIPSADSAGGSCADGDTLPDADDPDSAVIPF